MNSLSYFCWRGDPLQIPPNIDRCLEGEGTLSKFDNPRNVYIMTMQSVELIVIYHMALCTYYVNQIKSCLCWLYASNSLVAWHHCNFCNGNIIQRMCNHAFRSICEKRSIGHERRIDGNTNLTLTTMSASANVSRTPGQRGKLKLTKEQKTFLDQYMLRFNELQEERAGKHKWSAFWASIQEAYGERFGWSQADDVSAGKGAPSTMKV